MLLEINDLDAGYGFLQILRGVSLSVKQGEYVCIVGPNGAGKSTTLKTIVGMIEPKRGVIKFSGQKLNGLPTNEIVAKGISLISEEMNLFTNMTVKENLEMGAFIVNDKKVEKNRIEFVFNLFPRLEERMRQLAGTMSGGERKMLAIGRGIMSNPQLLIVDEPSFGLDPNMVKDVFDALDVLNRENITILLVEQNATKALAVTDRGYILERGRVKLTGKSWELAENPYVKKAFLGV